MNKKRLLKLAEYLETKVPRERFSMADWIRGPKCGTAGCALGWATTIPSFRRAGFVAAPMDSYPDEFLPEFMGHRGTSAGMAFFDIGPGEAYELFMPSPGHRTPKQVARRIRSLVAKAERTKSL